MAAQTEAGLAPQVVVTVGAARIGIAADCVQRALAAPDQYTPLPRRHGGLLGMLAVDGRPVPVIDLASWVALANAPGAARQRRVLLLAHGTRTAALQVDTLEPLAGLPASAVVRLCHDDDPAQLFHRAAIVPDSGETLALLSVGHLFDLAQSWCEAAGVAQQDGVAATGAASAASQTWALLEAYGEQLALRADHLAEVTAMPALERCIGGSDVSLCNWRGSPLAVLPLERLLGGADAVPAPLLAVLRLGELALGLPVRAVRELRQVALDVQGVRSEDVGGLPCLTISGAAGETVRLIDTEALFARHPESALNREQPGAAGDGRRRNQGTYVVVAAAGRLALPIDAFEEVLQAPATDCVAAPAGAGMTFNWRGSAIAVRDLRPQHAVNGGQVVLVVLRTADAPVALAVEQVVAMITPGSAELTRMQRGDDVVELLIVAEEAGHATYRVADPAVLLAAATA